MSPFERAIQYAINTHSKESDSNTPDFILAQYLSGCLQAFNQATQQRETWYERDASPSDRWTIDSRTEPASQAF